MIESLSDPVLLIISLSVITLLWALFTIILYRTAIKLYIRRLIRNYRNNTTTNNNTINNANIVNTNSTNRRSSLINPAVVLSINTNNNTDNNTSIDNNQSTIPLSQGQAQTQLNNNTIQPQSRPGAGAGSDTVSRSNSIISTIPTALQSAYADTTIDSINNLDNDNMDYTDNSYSNNNSRRSSTNSNYEFSVMQAGTDLFKIKTPIHRESILKRYARRLSSIIPKSTVITDNDNTDSNNLDQLKSPDTNSSLLLTTHLELTENEFDNNNNNPIDNDNPNRNQSIQIESL